MRTKRVQISDIDCIFSLAKLRLKSSTASASTLSWGTFINDVTQIVGQGGHFVFKLTFKTHSWPIYVKSALIERQCL